MNLITITIVDTDPRRGTVDVQTTAPQPQPGRALTPGQALAMDLLRQAKARAATVTYGHAIPHLCATLRSAVPTVIALTGHPVAQEAAHLQLQALIAERKVPLRVLSGLTSAEEATAIMVEGGQVWHCGTDPARDELAALIDRELPANTFEAMGDAVRQAFEACLSQEVTHA